MLRILKAEIVYNQPVFLYILICSLIGFLSLHYWPLISGDSLSNPNTGYVYLIYVYFYFVMSILMTPWSKEKRVRYLIQLPIGPRQMRWAHLSLFLTYWLVILIHYLLFILISPAFSLNPLALTSLGVMSGMGFFVYALIGFASRFPDSTGRRLFEGFVIVIFGSIGTAGIVHTFQEKPNADFLDSVISWVSQSSLSLMIWLVLSIGLSLGLIFSPKLRSYK